ncbi:F/Y-rich N-terminus family protein [Tritrichomonas foetus]|uniref:F/Y-rich N-terminus family protein n=1 Tax=Tritrichomonas foetus TaxID=1144522 RepID=A0A1J4KPW4_9EUKA|nr:F/Y-rich N-terminus family protein [Tritrichomonas foetus]|eukprot:OHT11469.1 F/Y-rich N-terminus family protein [Tritrichomonas foetus]
MGKETNPHKKSSQNEKIKSENDSNSKINNNTSKQSSLKSNTKTDENNSSDYYETEEEEEEEVIEEETEEEEEEEEHVEEEEEEEEGGENEITDQKRISKVLAHRINEDGKKEFLVKYANHSYRDVEWIVDANNTSKKLVVFRSYLRTHREDEPPPEPYFSPNYIIPEKIIGSRQHDGKNQYLVKWTDLEYDNLTWEDSENFNFPEIIKAFNESQRIPSLEQLFIPPHPNPKDFKPLTHHASSKSGYTIRQYQLSGLNFLINSWFNKRNAIIADEMGLGKTVQVVLFLNYLDAVQKLHGPFLIIVPLSTIPHWEREISEWSDLSYINFHGDSIRRNVMKKYELFYPETTLLKFTICLTTYEYILKEENLFSSVKWRCVVIDEAHRIKNHQSKLFTALKAYKCDFKLLMTGTPLQNNTDELWSLLHFLDPEAFKDLTKFQESYGKLSDSDQIIELQSILKPLLLRRLKSDVEKSIAPLEEIIIECPMTSYQKIYYKSIYNKNMDYLSRGAHQGNTTNLRNIQMELRKTCNHPFLIAGAEDQIFIELKEKHNLSGEPLPDNFELDMLIRTAGKMILLNKLLAKLKQDNHRVLIFSQMTDMLDIIQDYLDASEYKYQRIDGSIRSQLRQEAIDHFNAPDSDDFVFLLSTRAGGVGINLASADTVIIYDSDFNPQNDIQATARCHRIGQKKEVKLYRFITAKSYERKMFDRASIKLGLDHAVLETAKDTGNSLFEIEKLLRLGAYYAFEEEDDNKAADTFGEEDIESVISRSTRIQHAGIVGGEGSTFSTAYFEISEDENQVDLTAPDFWQKYIPVVNDDDEIEGRSIAERYILIRARSSSEDLAEKDKKSDDSEQSKKRKEKKEKSQEDKDQKFKKWSNKALQSLLNNLLRFGWGRWVTIIEASNLKNPAIEVIGVCHLILRWLLAASNENYPVMSSINQLSITKDNGEEEMMKFQEYFTKEYRSNFGSSVTNGANWKLARLDMLYFIDTLLKSAQNPPSDIPIPPVQVSKPTDWWTVEDDRKLVYFTWKYGFSNYTNEFEFTQPSTDDNPIQSSKLTARLKALITNMKSYYAKYKQQKDEEIPFSCESIKQALDVWTKKEHRNAVRTLIHDGFYNMEKFKTLVDIVTKSDENVEQYVNVILDYCRAIKASEPTESFPILEQIFPKTAAKILSRVQMFQEIFENVNNSKYEAQQPLLQYLLDEGLSNVTESELVRKYIPENKEVGEKVVCSYIYKLFHIKEPKPPKPPKPKTPRPERQIKTRSSEPRPPRRDTIPNLESNEKFYIDPPPFDRDNEGNIIYPIQVTSKVKLVSIGTVNLSKNNFWNGRYIFPDGFVVEREFTSIANPNTVAMYRGSIYAGDSGPIFRVECLDSSHKVFEASKPSNPWLGASQAIEDTKREMGMKTKDKVTISGPVFFGLTIPFVTYLIQKLPNADQCSGYTMKKYCLRDELDEYEEENEYEYVEEEEEEEEEEGIENEEEEEEANEKQINSFNCKIEFNFALLNEHMRNSPRPKNTIMIPSNQLIQQDMIDVTLPCNRNMMRSDEILRNTILKLSTKADK